MKDLLLYSAVCGTGLDTVPLPGDVTADQLYALLLDLAFLSQRLDKPLTARLMPVPGKKAGDADRLRFSLSSPTAASWGSMRSPFTACWRRMRCWTYSRAADGREQNLTGLADL